MQMYLTHNQNQPQPQQVSRKQTYRRQANNSPSLPMDISQSAGSETTIKSQESCSISSSGSLVSNSDKAIDYTASSTTSPMNLVDQQDDLNQQQNSAPSFYIDELGFYRHLDSDTSSADSCWMSQTFASNSPTCKSPVSRDSDAATTTTTTTTATTTAAARRRCDSSYEAYYNEIRSDLRISHFDRIVGYDEWKRDWDDFMRVKMGEPAVLNQKLKHRVRTGIPHDYRSKMWSAVISMRTKKIRAAMGEPLCSLISRELANNNNNNNNGVSPKPSPDKCLASHAKQLATSSSSLSSSSTLSPPEQPLESAGEQPADKQKLGGWFSWTKRRSKSSQQQKQLITGESRRLKSKQQKLPQMDICFKQIELDLLRTLPNNCHFETSHSRGIKRVRKVLRAYALFNPTIGYCQGMNRLAAMSLLVLPEQEAFWCLVTIIQCIMPKDYYLKPWLAQVDCDVLKDFMAKRIPRLCRHLTDYDIHPNLFSWFFTIFVDGFRPELLLRIWDCFLLEGDEVLFKFALAILFISSDDLLTMTDSSAVVGYLNRLVSTTALDVEHLFEVAFVRMDFITSNDIKSRREHHRKRLRLVFDEV